MPSAEVESEKLGPLSVRAWIAVALGLFSILFILVNWDTTEVSFLLFKAEMPLTIALAISFVGGMATGALWMRRHTHKA